MESLFLQSNLQFEKLASGTTMPEDPNQWPQEIVQELFKQVPYMTDFTPHVTMQQSDGERGFAIGFITVMNQTEVQQVGGAEARTAGIRQVRIPVVIREGKLMPLDLLITDDAKMYPLTESRLRTAIFRPQAFDVTSKTPGDQSMIGQLYPPYRQNYGVGGMVMPAGEMGKGGSALEQYLKKESNFEDEHGTGGPPLAERPGAAKDKQLEQPEPMKPKTASVLQAILPTINGSDLESFKDTIRDQDVRLAYEKNAEATVGPVTTLLGEKLERSKIAMSQIIKPSVTQVVRLEDGYKVKSAHHRMWEPEVRYLSRSEAIGELGAKVVLSADLSGAATVAEDATAEAEAAPDSDMQQAGPITEPGLYRVQTEDGQELIGYVIPSLVDVTGEQVPIALFTNGSQAAVQADIIGTPVQGEASDLPTGDVPNGPGVFFTSEGGEIVATIPLTVKSSTAGPDLAQPTVYQAETYDGNPIEVSVQPNIQAVMGTPEGRMLVPEHWQWSPLDKTGEVALASAEPDVNKEAAALRTLASVDVVSGGSTFSVRGPAISKLANADTEFLNLDDAMFLLAGLGVAQGYGMRKLAEATAAREPVQVRIGRYIATAEEQKLAAVKSAERVLGNLPVLRRPLFKEAAVISDPMAVDTVLSLGFINPENITVFVSYLPELDEAQAKMCELLLAARLGLNDVPEGALEKSVRATEEVLEGLKTLAFQGPAEYTA
jgi:hypothetical protein